MEAWLRQQCRNLRSYVAADIVGSRSHFSNVESKLPKPLGKHMVLTVGADPGNYINVERCAPRVHRGQ